MEKMENLPFQILKRIKRMTLIAIHFKYLYSWSQISFPLPLSTIFFYYSYLNRFSVQFRTKQNERQNSNNDNNNSNNKCPSIMQ